MIVYAGEDDSYITYITPSAYRELGEWIKYRKESGEIITDESWVMEFWKKCLESWKTGSWTTTRCAYIKSLNRYKSSQSPAKILFNSHPQPHPL
jgi:hypothetical protein